MSARTADAGTSQSRHSALTQLRVTETLRAYQRAWFHDLRERVENRDARYVLADGCTPHEIFVALDIPVVVDVWYSGLVAARRQSAYFAQRMTDLGYHDGLSRYQSLGVGVALDASGAEKPWGGLPRPELILGCPPDPSQEVMAAHFGVPCIGIEPPAPSRADLTWWEMDPWAWEESEGDDRIAMMLEQFKGVVGHAERIAGKKLDIDRLREVMATVNAQQEEFHRVRQLICDSPKLPVRLGEVLTQVMVAQWHRGTPWALGQARAFRQEVEERVAAEAWVCAGERHRLMYIGEGLWQQTDFFAEFEESAGVVFPRSNYLSIACDAYPRYGLNDPLRALASRYTTFNLRMHLPPWAGAWALHEARTHRLDGAVLLARGPGRQYIAKTLERNGFPVLELPVDPVDGRSWDTERMRSIVESFINERLAGGAAA